jgi:hypothetical protein
VEKGTSEPKWSFYVRTRNDTCLGVMSTDGALPPVAVTGSSDGDIRKPDATNADDDSDTYAKKATIKTGHFIFGDQSGSLMHARSFKQLEAQVVAPNDDVAVSVWTGDDDASNALAPSASKTIVAVSDTDYVQSSNHLVPIHKSGKGITIQYDVTSPTEFEYRGQTVFYDHSGIENRPAR